MKKLISILLLFAVLLFFGGCFRSVSIGYSESSHSGKMSGSYFLLNGTKEKSLTVDEGKTVDISVDIVTRKGTLDVYIYKDEEDYAYEGHAVKTGKFTVTLNEPGKYTIKIVAKKHKGSYKFNW